MTQRPLFKLPRNGTALYRRRRGGNLYARIWVNGVMHRRSCRTRDKKTARRAKDLWVMQLARRGKPIGAKCNADLE